MYMDTVSLYFALSANSLDSLIKSDKKHEYFAKSQVQDIKPPRPITNSQFYQSLHENNRKIHLREKVDKKKLEYIINHLEDFELGSGFINRKELEKEGQLTLLKNYYSEVNQSGECIMGCKQRNCFGGYWPTKSMAIQNIFKRI